MGEPPGYSFESHAWPQGRETGISELSKLELGIKLQQKQYLARVWAPWFGFSGKARPRRTLEACLREIGDTQPQADSDTNRSGKLAHRRIQPT